MMITLLKCKLSLSIVYFQVIPCCFQNQIPKGNIFNSATFLWFHLLLGYVTLESNSVIRWKLVSFISAVSQSSRWKLQTWCRTLKNYRIRQSTRQPLPTCCMPLTNYHITQSTRRKLPICHRSLTNYHINQCSWRKLQTLIHYYISQSSRRKLPICCKSLTNYHI